MGRLIQPPELKQVIMEKIFVPYHLQPDNFFADYEKFEKNIFWLIGVLRKMDYLVEPAHIKEAFGLSN